MIALGIDPGFASFGWAAVRIDERRIEALGVIRTAKSPKKQSVFAADDNLRRAREIADRLYGVINLWKPAVICAEAMSFPRSASNAAKMAMGWGIVATLDLPLVQASPQAIKKAVCGMGSASKAEVIAAVMGWCAPGNAPDIGKLPVPRSQHEHCFDAAAAVIACADSDVVRAATRR